MKKSNLLFAVPIVLVFVAGCAANYAKKAQRAEAAGDYTSAIVLWDKVIEQNPDNIVARIDRGVDKSLTGDFQGAIDDYTGVIERDSTHVLAWVNRGKNRYRIDDYALAIDDYNRAIELKKTTIDGTVQYFDNSVDSRDVRYVEIVFERGMSYYELDSLDMAFADFDFCIAQSYLLERSHYFRGMIYALSGRGAEAAKDFESVLRHGSINPDSEYVKEAAARLSQFNNRKTKE
jgi:tetratricopeptide (TPR) repeat protein